MKEAYEYQKKISKNKKKYYGIVYTPVHIVDYINKKCLNRWNKTHPPKVIDFSSGTGVFLLDMAKKISEKYSLNIEEVYDKYIFANDLDIEATKIFREISGCNNITNLDGLGVDLTKYDIIVGNPPFIKIQNLDGNIHKKIRSFTWCTKGNTDLYIAMTQRFFDSGKIFGLICPNSWIKSETGSSMVADILKNRNMYQLIDFRGKKIFKENTYCSIILGDGTRNNSFIFSTDMDALEEEKEYNMISKSEFFLYDKEIQFILKINKKEHKISDFCSLKVGLATLSDSVYFLPECITDGQYVISKGIKIEESITKKCYKAGKLSRYDKQVDDRIIFPYDENKKVYSESKMQKEFPMAYTYLTANKQTLLNRDKKGCQTKVNDGKMKWYEFGRTQGFSLQDEKILISPIVTKKFFHKVNDGLFISGYCLEMKNKTDMQIVIDAIDSQEFLEWIALKGVPKDGGYFSINKKCVESFKFDKKKDKEKF